MPHPDIIFSLLLQQNHSYVLSSSFFLQIHYSILNLLILGKKISHALMAKRLADIACEQLQSLAIYGTIAPEKEDAHEFTIISHSEKL